MRIRHLALSAALFCLVTAGCTTTSEGDPTSVPTSDATTEDPAPPSSGSNDDLPSDGAPKVTNPLRDTAPFEQDPCLLLTAEQARELNLPANGEPDDIPYGVGCEWRNSDTRGTASIALLNGDDRGLSSFYAAKQRDEFAYFDELPDIEGYPAIASDSEDRRPRGICVVVVGVTDQLVVDLYLQLSESNVDEKDPCQVAADVAGMTLRTMKDGA